MSLREPSTDTLEPSSLKPDISSAHDLGINDSSKEANELPISALNSATSLKRDGSQQGSHVSVDLDDGVQTLRRVELDVAESDGFDASTELKYRKELMSMSPKPALSRADKYGSHQAQCDGVPNGSSSEGAKDGVYLDPTPKTPCQESSPSRTPSTAAETQDNSSTSEIQSIMDQFDEVKNNIVDGETGQPTLGAEKSHLGTPMEHPPRRPSLEPSGPRRQQSASDPTLDLENQDQEGSAFERQFRAPPVRTTSLPQSVWLQDKDTPSSPNSAMSLPKSRPPEPDPEPDLPFDFHRFLEQLRHRTADPVAKFLRSFLIEFGKKQWMVHEQVKIINDFLAFITNKMAQCEVWRGVSDAEFDNAKEGMEKLVMNRLYSQTFSPAIPAPAPVQTAKGKRKADDRAHGPGRKGQHQEDIERDEILAQKVRIYGWVQEKHLDIPRVGDSGRRFLILAEQGEASHLSRQLQFKSDIPTELLKIKTYRAPRDKVICVLNCCKVIFGEIVVRRTRGK